MNDNCTRGKHAKEERDYVEMNFIGISGVFSGLQMFPSIMHMHIMDNTMYFMYTKTWLCIQH